MHASSSRRTAGSSLEPGGVLDISQMHRERDELLLSTVVDVAFQTPAFLDGRRRQSLAARSQLLGLVGDLVDPSTELRRQRHPVQRRTGLGRELGEQPFIGAPQGPIGGSDHRDIAHDLAELADLDDVQVGSAPLASVLASAPPPPAATRRSGRVLP